MNESHLGIFRVVCVVGGSVISLTTIMTGQPTPPNIPHPEIAGRTIRAY